MKMFPKMMSKVKPIWSPILAPREPAPAIMGPIHRFRCAKLLARLRDLDALREGAHSVICKRDYGGARQRN